MSFEAEPHGGLTPKQVEVAEQNMEKAEKEFPGFSSDPKAQTEAYKNYVDFYAGFIEKKGYQIDMKALQDSMDVFKNNGSLDLEHKGLGEDGGKTMRGWAKDIVEFMGFVGNDPKVQAQRNLLINKLLEEISAQGINVNHKIPKLATYSLSYDEQNHSIKLNFLDDKGMWVIFPIDLKDMVNSLDDKLLLKNDEEKVVESDEEEKVIKDVDVRFEPLSGGGRLPSKFVMDGVVYDLLEPQLLEVDRDAGGDFWRFHNIEGDGAWYKIYIPEGGASDALLTTKAERLRF